MTTGYCVKCRKKVEIEKGKIVMTKRGTKMLRGKCPRCRTTVCRMGA